MDKTQNPKVKTNGKRNRTAGHNFEREVVVLLRGIGFEHVVTTRSESRSRDDKKIDIMNKDEDKNGRLPFNIQCKCESKIASYPKYLSEMPKDGPMNVIFHKQTKRSGTKFMVQDMYSIFYLKDVLKLMGHANKLHVMKLELQKMIKSFDTKIVTVPDVIKQLEHLIAKIDE